MVIIVLGSRFAVGFLCLCSGQPPVLHLPSALPWAPSLGSASHLVLGHSSCSGIPLYGARLGSGIAVPCLQGPSTAWHGVVTHIGLQSSGGCAATGPRTQDVTLAHLRAPLSCTALK